ncbi:MAG TPA: hypothetical protein DCQ98_11970 [Planctomycetaceae bacterium]|nr:hypothetical protein [Planctomycetaceae bacterium]HRE99874.1 hypothetical protein [Pirellulaceae bacterium]
MNDLIPTWHPQPQAADLLERLIENLVSRSEPLARFSAELRETTGTRLFDWVDHLALPGDLDCEGQALGDALTSAGFVPTERPDRRVLAHPGALLPDVELVESEFRIVLKVDSVVDFLVARGERGAIVGGPFDRRRQVRLTGTDSIAIWVVERHGDRGWYASPPSIGDPRDYADWFERVRLRDRGGLDAEHGFAVALSLIDEGNAKFGVDPSCSAFFEAERSYWQVRNRAGRLQKGRQDRMGLGWANHDHHTYRSSREAFRSLIAALEKMGFRRRERFYAGRDAGWGAQVMEQPNAGITIFADVDLSAEELQGDFATEGLVPRSRFGTVGLWCALHGEAFLEAGMHHLECQFDFESAREQLAVMGVGSMAPFTNFDYLRQCFTEGERWKVSPARLERLLSLGAIDAAQAERFARDGAVGSHLEILERNDGFKGFNQTGISDIILKTDPRVIRPH